MTTSALYRSISKLSLALPLCLAISNVNASTLKVAMTAADIPLTLGQPDQGYEGNRFTGITLYDSLIEWDLSQGEKPSGLVPGLATSWHVDKDDHTKWIIKLRSNVTFHDGTPFNADAVVWNVNKVLDKGAIQYAPNQVGSTVSRMPTLRSARKIDENTVELTTSVPDAVLPYNITNLFIVSPSAWQKDYDEVDTAITDIKKRASTAWTIFAANAVGTGPFKMTKLVPHQQLVMSKNANYWNPQRIPRVDKVILIPLPEANARTAALLSGQVDWIEAPSPEAMSQIKAKGFKIYANQQPHLWPWQFSFAKDSPWLDIRVRKAANLCINRDDLKAYLHGYMSPATGTYEEGSPWRGNPTFNIKYDLETARKLMKEAGYGPSKTLSVTVQTSASGSGQMQPLPMNEYIQESLKSCYFDVNVDVAEWNTLLTNWRLGAKVPQQKGINAINVTAAIMDPFFGMIRFSSKTSFPPTSNNWGYFTTPEIEKLVKKIQNSFDPKAMDKAAGELNAAMIDSVPFLYVAHDVGPRAISPKVTGVVQPQSWFIDLAIVTKK
ncbi:MAG: ABC transporter substrate-binding protein [Marinomonas sp.]